MLRERVLALPADDRVIDLAVVSHIDSDHIGGLLALFTAAADLGVQFGDVWFNAGSAKRRARGPDLFCDIVMKGGITSGVVYPHAVCELTSTLRLKNVGGTSAGAIAQAATAAAEYGRQGGSVQRGSRPCRSKAAASQALVPGPSDAAPATAAAGDAKWRSRCRRRAQSCSRAVGARCSPRAGSLRSRARAA